LGIATRPDATRGSDPEMVHYEPTPARVILDLVDHAGLRADDVLYDLGSGLGQVVILVNLLTGIPTRGVECQSALCAAARGYAEGLGLWDVAFVEADARAVDFADGTMFYLFTPFRGRML